MLKKPIAIKFYKINNKKAMKEIAEIAHKEELRKDKETQERLLRESKEK